MVDTVNGIQFPEAPTLVLNPPKSVATDPSSVLKVVINRKQKHSGSDDQIEMQTDQTAMKRSKISSTLSAATTTTKSKVTKSISNTSQSPPKPIDPSPILPVDIRRTYPIILLNAFNSCDVRKLQEVLNTYCTEDMIAIHRYEGKHNPYARPNAKLKGRRMVYNMWEMLFKSAPDFYFTILETRAFYDPRYRVVVATKFTWFGTRVMDVKYSEQINEVILQSKLQKREELSIDINNILSQMINKHHINTLGSVKNTLPGISGIASSSEESGSTVKNESLFGGENEFVAEEVDHISGKFYLEEIPMIKQQEMRCKGTFIVYLNDDNLIYQYEAVYISVEEAEAIRQRQELQLQTRSSLI
jgi:hypothetical protein